MVTLKPVHLIIFQVKCHLSGLVRRESEGRLFKQVREC